jgi:hypothetical protein
MEGGLGPDALGGRRRASDVYEAAREEELRIMALKLETACAQLEEQRRSHDAAVQQVAQPPPRKALPNTESEISHVCHA